MASIRWYGRDLIRSVNRTMDDRLKKAGRHLVDVLWKSLDTPYPPASVPGEYPHRRTGELQESIRWEKSGPLSVRVVADAEHAEHVEAMRPFMRRVMREERGRVTMILLKG